MVGSLLPAGRCGDCCCRGGGLVGRRDVAFGHGVRFCLGPPWPARRPPLRPPGLFARFPRMRLAVRAEDLQPLLSIMGNGRASLPVRLTPA
jgi:hypothetical protein